ncbi:helix-turn-helix transcriptional regulator [Streptomyces sp. NPDC000594]|uniref:helix-turn-helix transcriptional regulator n=1 Tax=Streptomyces sp. NPDC000594 TaxID=3154261 RepID=UPI00333183CD
MPAQGGTPEPPPGIPGIPGPPGATGTPGSPGLVGRRREIRRLQRIVDDLAAGRGGALLLLGDQGIGKTALLASVRTPPGTTVLRTGGGERYGRRDHDGLRRLCAPLSASVAGLPKPRRRALEAVFHPGADGGPDPFLVAAATLALLSEASAERPVLCVIDDAHGLDRASVRALAFAARRAGDTRVAFLLAARRPDDGTDDGTDDRPGDPPGDRIGDGADDRVDHRADERIGGRSELASLPSLLLTGLPERDARGLLARAPVPLDRSVRDRVIAEAGGNPLALLELSRAAGLPAPDMPPGPPLEARLRGRITALPPDTRTLLLVAAAEPTGHPLHLWRALRHLGIGTEAAAPAEEAALLRVDLWIRFGHPRIRSLVWYGATPAERRTAHRALAAAAEAAEEPDRRLWHHAQSLPGPDEATAGALERSAAPERAPGRAAAFLEAAARLTPDARDRAARILSAAATRRDAGAHDAAERLLALARAAPLDQRLTARAEALRARMALDRGRYDTAAGLLGRAAALMSPVDAALAREIQLDAVAAAGCAGRLATGQPAPGIPPAPGPPRPLDLLLDALTERERAGLTAAAPALRRALRAYLDGRHTHPYGPGEAWALCGAAIDLWDESAWRRLADRQLRNARRAAAPTLLPAALSRRALVHVHAGDLGTAAALLREIGALPGGTTGWGVSAVRIVLAAWRGERARTAELAVAARRDAFARGGGELLTAVGYARALLSNGLGRPADAVRAWRTERHLDESGPYTWGLVELVEAAARAGEPDLAHAALDGVLHRTRACSTDWALGVCLRSRALLGGGAEAGDLHEEAVRRLDRGEAALDAARGRLLYGAWLRAGGYRADARTQLHRAYTVFSARGATAFAARTARELRAAGEPARALRPGRPDPSALTPQEHRIARLVATGATSREVGAELNLSPRTVEAHLRGVFKKMGILSRRQLHDRIPLDGAGPSVKSGDRQEFCAGVRE